MDEQNNQGPSKKDIKQQNARNNAEIVGKEIGKKALQAYGVPPGLSKLVVDKAANNPLVKKGINKVADNPLAQKGLNQMGQSPKQSSPKNNSNESNSSENSEANAPQKSSSVLDKFGSQSSGESESQKGSGFGHMNSKTKTKLTMYVLGGILGFFAIILIIATFTTVLLAPIIVANQLVEEAKSGISIFFERLGNLITLEGWCTEAECQDNDEKKFFEKMKTVQEEYMKKYKVELDVGLIASTLFYNNTNFEEVLESDTEVEEIDYDNAKGEITKLAKQMVKDETVEKDCHTEAEPDKKCSERVYTISHDNYMKYLIDEYIPNNGKMQKLFENLPEEEQVKKIQSIADDIVMMANSYAYLNGQGSGISGSGGGEKYEGDTSNLFPMLPNISGLSITSMPQSCRCHPTKFVYRSHYGVDISGGLTYGTPVLALNDGVVAIAPYIATTRVCGSSIIKLKHTLSTGEVYYTRYVHLNRSSNGFLSTLKVDKFIAKGTVIGYVGGTADEDSCSTGPHLHFEMFDASGTIINPVKVLEKFREGIEEIPKVPILGCANSGQAC